MKTDISKLHFMQWKNSRSFAKDNLNCVKVFKLGWDEIFQMLHNFKTRLPDTHRSSWHLVQSFSESATSSATLHPLKASNVNLNIPLQRHPYSSRWFCSPNSSARSKISNVIFVYQRSAPCVHNLLFSSYHLFVSSWPAFIIQPRWDPLRFIEFLLLSSRTLGFEFSFNWRAPQLHYFSFGCSLYTLSSTSSSPLFYGQEIFVIFFFTFKFRLLISGSKSGRFEGPCSGTKAL